MGASRFAARLRDAGVPDDAAPAISSWLHLLVSWNARIDLTAARTDDDLVDLMVVDALALAPRMVKGARIVDVGSGAGAPGLALALTRPDLAVTLVEPLAKRVSFLRTVVGTLGRSDIVLVRDKGESLAARGETFEVSVSRATLPPAAWIPLGLSLAPSCWALLAREEPPAIPGAHVEEDLVYRLPLGGAGRRAVRYARDS